MTRDMQCHSCVVIIALSENPRFMASSVDTKVIQGNGVLKFSASSSVSLKNGDDGDSFVKFPVMSFCKIPDPKLGFWKKVQPCTGSNFATCFFRIRNLK